MTIRADVVVVGLGLVGAAATRHLALAGMNVVGVGPGEPADMAQHAGPYSSHYDSGRVTRRLDARKEWAILASRAIEQYPAIEASSGIEFHNPAGLVFVRNDPAGITNQLQVIEDLTLDVGVSTIDTSGAVAGVSSFVFPPGWTSLHESGPAGAINPRAMIDAQLVAAERAGAKVRRETATSLERAHEGGWLIETPSNAIHARTVLLATGPYLQDLHDRQLQASVRPEAVIVGFVSDKEAERLRAMPSAIYLLDHPDIDDTYFVPPVRYPDGRFAVKMGGSNAHASLLRSNAEKAAWMAGSAADAQLDVMTEVLTSVLPNVAFQSFEMRPCLITDTPTGLPYVDQIEPNMFVAAGGNGHAAKSADAIGALAAGLVTNEGEWLDDELDRADFTVRFGDWTPPEGSRHGN